MFNLDSVITHFDKALRTLFASAYSARPSPAHKLSEAALSTADKGLAASLMRVNHSGEVCAQALYEGQAAVARDDATRQMFQNAAKEESEHLAWCEERIKELGGHKSLLNPLLYAGSFGLGVVAGALGDKWNLGFLAETERQVERHLSRHISRLPVPDQRSRAVLNQMRIDEGRHATHAEQMGGSPLPKPIRYLMATSSKLMTHTTFWV